MKNDDNAFTIDELLDLRALARDKAATSQWATKYYMSIADKCMAQVRTLSLKEGK